MRFTTCAVLCVLLLPVSEGLPSRKKGPVAVAGTVWEGLGTLKAKIHGGGVALEESVSFDLLFGPFEDLSTAGSSRSTWTMARRR
jgi:hypothetical protein